MDSWMDFLSTWRVNCRTHTYAEIVMCEVADIKAICNNLKQRKCGLEESCQLYREAEQKTMIVTVFSALTLESFFNDCLATKLGDDKYYHSREKDKLERKSAVTKFEKICEKVLRCTTEDEQKQKELKKDIQKLFKARDNLVHSKSKDAAKKVHTYAMTEEEYEECIKYEESLSPEEKEAYAEMVYKDEIESNASRAEELVRMVYKKLQTFKELAEFMDDHLGGMHAHSELLLSNTCGCRSDERHKQIVEIQKELDVPTLL